MPVVPTLSNYQTILLPRLVNSTLSDQQKYGYNFSEDSISAACFRSMLDSNINTFVTNQLTPESTADVDWTKSSIIRGTSPAQRNGQYYYYNNITSIPSSLSATTLSPLRKIITSPTGIGTKTVIADGENIQINTNIYYTGSSNTLVIIARKNAK
jgi:hypothetical protein